jgi:hypothetical protein
MKEAGYCMYFPLTCFDNIPVMYPVVYLLQISLFEDMRN